jgi:hypothetical protein
VKEFSTAVNAALEPQELVPFMVDGVELHAYYPTEGQIAVATAAMTAYSKDYEKVAAIINFFVGVLDEKSHQHLVGRLLDRNDTFGADEVNNIMEWLIEEWTARPTQSPSGSTASPSNGGRKSTGSARSRVLTPSNSGQTVSAT